VTIYHTCFQLLPLFQLGVGLYTMGDTEQQVSSEINHSLSHSLRASLVYASIEVGVWLESRLASI